eukprot:1259933-Amphidinium_carterae.2
MAMAKKAELEQVLKTWPIMSSVSGDAGDVHVSAKRTWVPALPAVSSRSLLLRCIEDEKLGTDFCHFVGVCRRLCRGDCSHQVPSRSSSTLLPWGVPFFDVFSEEACPMDS